MRLPPLNSLRAFEAAARHRGYVGAAEELHVTRGAVSRHVKLLEAHLGVALFKRLPKGLELTGHGRRFLPVLTEAFARITDEARRISRSGADLRIICPPTFSIRWLIPKLDRFREEHPDIHIRLTTDFYGEAGFDASEYDLGFAINNRRKRPADIRSLPLLPTSVSPACTPRFLRENGPLTRPEDIAGKKLLHENPKHEDWKAWLAHFKVEGVDPESGDAFPNLDMAVKAAVMGTGIVMGDLLLCQEEFRAGTLVMPFQDMKCETDGWLCLIGREDRWSDPMVEAFKHWIAEESAKDVAGLVS